MTMMPNTAMMEDYFILQDKQDGTFVSPDGGWTSTLRYAKQFATATLAQTENDQRGNNYHVIPVTIRARTKLLPR